MSADELPPHYEDLPPGPSRSGQPSLDSWRRSARFPDGVMLVLKIRLYLSLGIIALILIVLALMQACGWHSI